MLLPALDYFLQSITGDYLQPADSENTVLAIQSRKTELTATLFPRSPYTDWRAGVYTQTTASSCFYPRHEPSYGEEGLPVGNICICFFWYRQEENIYQLMDLGSLKGVSKAQL